MRAANAERAPDGNAEKWFRSIKDLIRRKRTKDTVPFLSQGVSIEEWGRPGYPAISRPANLYSCTGTGNPRQSPRPSAKSEVSSL